MQEVKNAIFQMRFPQKLWYLLNLRTDVILWGGTGRTILLNYRILQNYLQCEESIFKTTNISSFVRQLNLYGFRKVTSHLQDPLCNSSNPHMHEYVHDYFQFGRPELLNKITRKALTVRKNLKANVMYSNEETMYTTPLEKARRGFRLALKKAAQELYAQNSPRDLFNFETDGNSEMLYEDEVEFDWCVQKDLDTAAAAVNASKNISPPPPCPAPTTEKPKKKKHTATIPKVIIASEEKIDSVSQDSTLNNFYEDSGNQSNDNFSNQFLSMPDLDAEPAPPEQTVELLAEFDINNECDDGITKKITNNQPILNCMLSSISHDDVSLVEKNDQVMDHYNGEWDQMFNDLMNKGNNQELVTSSEAKDFFSHISKTLDLLNS